MMPSILIIISFSKNMKKALVSGLYYSISIILKNPEVGEDMEWCMGNKEHMEISGVN